MKRTVRWLAILGVAAGAAWFARTRRRGALPGLVTHRFNPLVMRFGLAGGRRSPWAVLEHVGRISGTTYHTPISLIWSEEGDHVFVRLSYGSDVHWVKNVRATGHCRVQLHETILELDEPAVVGASDVPFIPARIRASLERAGRTYLRLHILERVPGTFARFPWESAPGTLPVPATALELLDPAPAHGPAPVADGVEEAPGAAEAEVTV